MIASIDNFPSIPSLENLSLNNNNISNLSGFINSIKSKFPKIKSINSFKNPMNPGIMNPQNYSQFKAYMQTITNLQFLDGMNINDNSFMNQQGQHTKVDFFGNSNNQPNPATNSNMFASMNPAMSQNPPQKQKMGLFDGMPSGGAKSLSQSVMFTGSENRPINSDMNVNNGKVYKRQMFVIDESGELDGTEFVNSKKKKSLIMYNEKIFRKSDNMTNFNRKNRSEGNKHILNSDL